jgi:succinoglycan biosynthesis protein ExoA
MPDSKRRGPLTRSRERCAVSFVIPAREEERHLKAAVESVVAQSGLDDTEVIIVLARSRDRSAQIARELEERFSPVRVLDNPAGTISAAINSGVEAARHDVVMRVDAHSVIPDGYARLAWSILQETGAANVGGVMRAVGSSRFEVAVAWAYNSGRGLGHAVYHVGGKAGPADSAYLGTFRRERFLSAGGFDDALGRGEDWDFNYRLRAQGDTVWFDPRLEVHYRPRSSYSGLARQFHASGRWRAQIVRRRPRTTPLRYFVPPVLVVAMATGLVCGALSLAAAGALGMVLAVAAAAPFVFYLAWLLVTALRVNGSPRPSRLVVITVLVVMHMAWGAGFLASMTKRGLPPHAHSGR